MWLHCGFVAGFYHQPKRAPSSCAEKEERDSLREPLTDDGCGCESECECDEGSLVGSTERAGWDQELLRFARLVVVLLLLLLLAWEVVLSVEQ